MCNQHNKGFLMLKYILILTSLLSSNLIACSSIKKYENNKIELWLGNNSQFSKKFLKAKCTLDQELEGVPLARRKIIAKLILKSYDFANEDIKEAIY
jgi:hypothetical protein